jgi:hypothetical protein
VNQEQIDKATPKALEKVSCFLVPTTVNSGTLLNQERINRVAPEAQANIWHHAAITRQNMEVF